MSLTVRYAPFSSELRTIQELLDMDTATHGSQFEVSPSSIEAICASYTDDEGQLLNPLEVCVLNGVEFLTGGAHRRAALAQIHHRDLDLLVPCLVYECSTADQVAARIMASNGSRKMTTTEQKYVTLAAACEFGSADVDGLVEALYASTNGVFTTRATDRVLALQSILASNLRSNVLLDTSFKPTMTPTNAHNLATKLIGALRTLSYKTEVDVDFPDSYKKDGVTVIPGDSTTKLVSVKYLEQLMSDDELLDSFCDTVIDTINNAATLGVFTTTALVEKANAHRYAAEIVTDSVQQEDGQVLAAVSIIGNQAHIFPVYVSLIASTLRNNITALFD